MTQEDIIRMAREAGVYGPFMGEDEDLERFAQLVAAAEREACAKVCDDLKITGLMLDAYSCNDARYRCAEAIRARGQQ